MDLQQDLENKTEEIAKETARAGKKLFAFVIQGEAELMKGAINAATFIPRKIIEGASQKISDKQYKGRQSIKKLIGSGAKLENIPINGDNVKMFNSVARKYGIDYSLKKAVTPQEDGSEKTQYIVFYKAKDINVLENAFTVFTARLMEQERKKAVQARVKDERTTHRERENRERTREKRRERTVEII